MKKVVVRAGPQGLQLELDGDAFINPSARIKGTITVVPTAARSTAALMSLVLALRSQKSPIFMPYRLNHPEDTDVLCHAYAAAGGHRLTRDIRASVRKSWIEQAGLATGVVVRNHNIDVRHDRHLDLFDGLKTLCRATGGPERLCLVPNTDVLDITPADVWIDQSVDRYIEDLRKRSSCTHPDDARKEPHASADDSAIRTESASVDVLSVKSLRGTLPKEVPEPFIDLVAKRAAPASGVTLGVGDGAAEQMAADVLVRKEPVTVVLGDPGSGKSSLLARHFQTLTHARASRHSAPVPLFFDLETQSGNPEELFEQSADPGHRKLSRRFVLIFDGLDKLAQNHGAFVRDLVQLSRHPAVDRAILSCKTSDWRQDWIRVSEGSAWTLQPMSTHSDGAIHRHLKMIFKGRAAAVWRWLGRNPRLLDLLRTPQFLHFFCDAVVDGMTFDAMPATRTAMLQGWISRLLDLQKIGPRHWFDEAQDALAAIAYQAMRSQPRHITRAQLKRDGLSLPKLVDRNGHQHDVLDLAKDAGILASSGDSARDPSVRFIHETIRDYFTALHIQSTLARDPDLRAALVDILADCAVDRAFLLALDGMSGNVQLRDNIIHILAQLDCHLAADAIQACRPISHGTGDAIAKICRDASLQCVIDTGQSDVLCALSSDVSLQALLEVITHHDSNTFWEIRSSSLARLDPKSRTRFLREVIAVSIGRTQGNALMVLAKSDPDITLSILEQSPEHNSEAIKVAAWREQCRRGVASSYVHMRDHLTHVRTLSPGECLDAPEPVCVELARMANPQAANFISDTLVDGNIALETRCAIASQLCRADPFTRVSAQIAIGKTLLRESLGVTSAGFDSDAKHLLESLARSLTSRSVYPPMIRRSVVRVLSESGTLNLWGVDDEWEEIGPCLWLRLNIVRHVRPQSQSDLWRELSRCVDISQKPSFVSRQVFRAMTRLDPSKCLSLIAPFVFKREHTVAEYVSMVSDRLPEWPEELADPVVALYHELPNGEWGCVTRAIARIPRSDAQAERLAGILASPCDAKAGIWMWDEALWNHPLIMKQLWALVDRYIPGRFEHNPLSVLAILGDRRAFGMLMQRLPAWVRAIDADDLFRALLDSPEPLWAYGLGSRDLAKEWGSATGELAECLGEMLSVLDEGSRKTFVASWMPYLNRHQRIGLYLSVRAQCRRRLFVLLSENPPDSAGEKDELPAGHAL